MRDEAVHHHPRAARPTHGAASGRLAELEPADALDLLGSVPYGRIVFTQHALPAIRVVNHSLLDGEIVIRTHADAALAQSLPGADGPGVVVAYEADAIDAETHTGWSVVVTGYARVLERSSLPASVTSPYLVTPAPWYEAAMTHLVVVRPEIVTGRLLLAAME